MSLFTGKALIVGGGIGGMAAALALAELGASVDLIDRDPDWRVYGAGITITGSTLRAFRDLGLMADIAREGFFTRGQKLFLFDGTLLAEQLPLPIAPDLPAAGAIMRPRLHQIMSSRVREAGVNVRLGVTVSELVQSEDCVEVRFSDGAGGRYALVVGADGIYSDMRRSIMRTPVEPAYTGQMSWRVVAPRPPGMDMGEFFFGHSHIAGINPCSQDEVYAFVLHPMVEPDRVPEAEQPGFLRDLLKDFGGSMGRIRDGIDATSSIVQRPLEFAFQDRPWHQGRVVLIGDAVHATTPNLASGAGIAVEDGLVLAEELAQFGERVEAGLASFTDRRFERCRFVVESSVAISRRQLEGAPADEIGMRMGQAMARLAEPI